MHKITEKTTIGELCGYEEYKPVSDYFFTNMTEDVWNNTLEHYGYEKCGFEETLVRLRRILKQNIKMVYEVYPAEERRREPDKAEVKMIYMPAGSGLQQEMLPYVIVCPGGAYARQWGLIEGLGAGAALNRQGYPAFILYYRTAQKPLLPKLIEDLAAAVRLVEEHWEEFRIERENYAVAGFSAGGHLAAEWGTSNHGWKQYGLPAPGALFLGYPSTSNDVFCDALEEAMKTGAPGLSSARDYLERVGGPGFTRERLREFSIEYHMEADYPPVCLAACKDDPVVPVESSLRLQAALISRKIPCCVRIAESGGHSFGVGNGTKLEGWLEEAEAFWKQQREVGRKRSGFPQ